MDLIQKYYVYEWVRPDFDVVFWVGKGTKKRAWNFRRNLDTNATIKHLAKKGLKPCVRILARFIDEQSAYDYEIERIAFLEPLGELTNKTPGGEGVRGEIISGDNNPFKRLDVIAKISGINHYTKKNGYIHPLTGTPNNSARIRCVKNNPSKMPGVKIKQSRAWDNERKKVHGNVVRAWWTEEKKQKKSEEIRLNPSKIPLEKRKAYSMRMSWYNSCVMTRHYWGA